jgi:hypothetical protein
MQVGVFVIQRVTENHISGHCRSEKVSRNLVKKSTLDGKTEILKREVLAVYATAPIVIRDTPPILIICPPVSAEEAEGEFICAEVAYWWRRSRCIDLFQ